MVAVNRSETSAVSKIGSIIFLNVVGDSWIGSVLIGTSDVTAGVSESVGRGDSDSVTAGGSVEMGSVVLTIKGSSSSLTLVLGVAILEELSVNFLSLAIF